VGPLIIDKPSDEEINEWWKWVLDIPAKDSPFLGGKNAGMNQIKPFWCLACTGGLGGKGGIDNNDRILHIGGHKKDHVIIPVFTRATCKEELGPGNDDAKAATHSKKGVEKADISVEINDMYKIVPTTLLETGPFEAHVPAGNVLDEPSLQSKAGDYSFYSAGYWLKIPSGDYRLTFGGSKGDFVTKVTYVLSP
jgi:hypothetical protein